MIFKSPFKSYAAKQFNDTMKLGLISTNYLSICKKMSIGVKISVNI